MITSSFVSQACTRANSQYNAPAKQAVSWQSEVLTVWRRLHIERDSMQAPPERKTRKDERHTLLAMIPFAVDLAALQAREELF
jgi:hypothetical protein